MEALGLACVQQNFLTKYSADATYTRPSPLTSNSPLELLTKLAEDERFDKVGGAADLTELEAVFAEHEDAVLEYWNAWELDDAMDQFRLSQEASVALIMTSGKAGRRAYSLNMAHVLAASHAVRVLLPVFPAQQHVSLLRQWWLLAIAAFVMAGRPCPDPEAIEADVAGKNWAYVERLALESKSSTDAHFLECKSALPPLPWGAGTRGGARVETTGADGRSGARHQGGGQDVGRRAGNVSRSSCDVCRGLQGVGAVRRARPPGGACWRAASASAFVEREAWRCGASCAPRVLAWCCTWQALF